MKNKILKVIVVILIMILIIGIFVYFINKNTKEGTSKMSGYELKSNINVVASLEDEITEDTAWCGTFNLIWNDLKNDLAKQDIVFTPQLKMVENLNKKTFNTSYLSEDSYYKTYGIPSIQLKEKIEKEIKEKFNETSDILDSFDWENAGPEDYFLYSMLKKEFEFSKQFTELPNGKFGNYENVKYFGINSSTDENVREQVEVLYYNSKDDFAIKLKTKTDDEVIISKGNTQNTFKEIYEEIQKNNQNYKDNKALTKNDTLKIPNIDFNVKKEYEELENNTFKFSNGEEYKIDKALQTIQFNLDKKGGKIRSEAGMMVNKSSLLQDKPREFLVNDTFCIFLKEKNKELPYFASKISDITKVQ